MGFYLELHCDTSFCPHGGSEEGFQGQRRAAVAKEARKHGWRVIDGHWRCAGCVADLAARDAPRTQQSPMERGMR